MLICLSGIFFADIIPYAIKYWKYIMSCLSHLKEISIICPDNASVHEDYSITHATVYSHVLLVPTCISISIPIFLSIKN